MLPLVPLLHVAAPPSRVWGVDLRVVAVAALASIFLIAALAFPDELRLLRRRLRRAGAAHCTIAVLAAFAVLQSAVPYDHFFAHNDGPAEASIHAAHCHTSPGSCADAPISSGPGQLLFSQPILPPPANDDALPSTAYSDQHALAGRTIPPELRPPIS